MCLVIVYVNYVFVIKLVIFIPLAEIHQILCFCCRGVKFHLSNGPCDALWREKASRANLELKIPAVSSSLELCFVFGGMDICGITPQMHISAGGSCSFPSGMNRKLVGRSDEKSLGQKQSPHAAASRVG